MVWLRLWWFAFAEAGMWRHPRVAAVRLAQSIKVACVLWLRGGMVR